MSGSKFTLRTEDKHEIIISQLSETLNLKTKSKVILWLIENFQKCENERLSLYNDVQKLERENKKYKDAMKAKVLADQHLFDIAIKGIDYDL